MIVTVTFNPAVDKTAQVDQLETGGLNRLYNVRLDAGGKGINVSKTLKAMHKDSFAAGFLAGNAGEFIEKRLEELHIPCHFLQLEGQTRTNLKILNAEMELTELNEAGPCVDEAALYHLEKLILTLTGPDTVVVLSGNVSPGAPVSIYKQLIRAIHRKGGMVILDADGDLLKEGVEARPEVIKPNEQELCRLFGRKGDVPLESLVIMARSLLKDTTRIVVISRGQKGSVFVTRHGVWMADALQIPFQSSVGAGDAMVAGLAWALDEKMPINETIPLAVALSAGACMTEGTQPANYELVEKLKEAVVWKAL